jgi:hypothetical protein
MPLWAWTSSESATTTQKSECATRNAGGRCALPGLCPVSRTHKALASSAWSLEWGRPSPSRCAYLRAEAAQLDRNPDQVRVLAIICPGLMVLGAPCTAQRLPLGPRTPRSKRKYFLAVANGVRGTGGSKKSRALFSRNTTGTTRGGARCGALRPFLLPSPSPISLPSLFIFTRWVGKGKGLQPASPSHSHSHWEPSQLRLWKARRSRKYSTEDRSITHTN